MAALKDTFDADAGRQLAAELAVAWPDFPTRRFTAGLAAELEPLELMARSGLLAERLAASLPASFPDAAAVLHRALSSPSFTGWLVLPCATFVAASGLEHPQVALPLLAALTPRCSSEFAIRPFIEHHPEATYAHLHEWVRSDDEHVRRLVSEGTRPRLPWGSRLRSLVADPAPNLPLLEALVDDESPYVRRSVANHLNDIAKDHPAVALALAEQWVGRSDGTAWVVRHGLRTLIKQGDVGALALLGVATDAPIELRGFTVEPTRSTIGETVAFSCTLALHAGAEEAVEAVVDYRVHYIGSRGTPKAPKVFKLTRLRLEPGVPVSVERRHRFEHVSIRRLHPGAHRIDVQVNGRVLGGAEVELLPEVDP